MVSLLIQFCGTGLSQFLEDISLSAYRTCSEGLLSYDPYLFKLETDYEDFIVGLFSELPTTSSFFKVSDRLFVHIHVPKEYIRNTDPEASTTKEYIPLLIRTLVEKGIIKEETHAMCQYHWRKDL